MTRDEVRELGFITPIDSVASICARGILSHNRAARLPHTSIANAEVNDRRANKVVPGGLRLHDYANLYLCPRNPMLSAKRSVHETICVLRVSAAVLDLPDVVVTDVNASRTYARFEPAPHGLRIVDHAILSMRYWTHPDDAEAYRRKGIKCAEVLVPHVVRPEHITGAFVSGTNARTQLAAVANGLPITVNADLFFVG